MAFAEWLAFNQVNEIYAYRDKSRDGFTTFPRATPQDAPSPADRLAYLFGRERAAAGGPSSFGRSPAAQLERMIGLRQRFRTAQRTPNWESGGAAASVPGDGGGRLSSDIPECQAVDGECLVSDVPAGMGPTRESIHAVCTALAIPLAAAGRCEEMEELLAMLSGVWEWRHDEAGLKSWMEHRISLCYLYRDEQGASLAREYARRAYCTSRTGDMDALFNMVDSDLRLGNMTSAKTLAACLEKKLDALADWPGADRVRVAEHLAFLAAKTWIWFSREEGSVQAFLLKSERAEKFTRDLADIAPEREWERQLVIQRIYADRLEVLIAGRAEPAQFDEALDALRSSSDDNYVVIFDSLEVMYAIRTQDFQRAAKAMGMLTTRYVGIPEFAASWTWDGFNKWMDSAGLDRSEPDVAGAFRTLTETLTEPKTPEKERRLLDLNSQIQERATLATGGHK